MADPGRTIETMTRVTRAAQGRSPSGPPVGQRLAAEVSNAHKLSDVDRLDFGDARFGHLKQAIAAVIRPVLSQQAAFNRAAAAALDLLYSATDLGDAQELTATLDSLFQEQIVLASKLERLAGQAAQGAVANETGVAAAVAQLAGHEVAIADLVDAVQEIERVVGVPASAHGAAGFVDRAHGDGAADASELALLRTRLGQLEADTAGLRDSVRQQRARLDLALRALRTETGPTLRQTVDELAHLRASALYEAFEERFRGSREDVLSHLDAYRGEIDQLAGAGAPVVDLGPGRGEWIELLGRSGIPAYGVDTNELLVAGCAERGLEVVHGDAVEHLTKCDESSLAAVTAFHLVEHLPVPVLTDLLDAALVALRPGGLLIFETPNPTNLTVGASTFYLDPTHLRPLHPDLLSFLVEAAGFVDVEVRFLHPNSTVRFSSGDVELQRALDHLHWAILGPQDYAVIARKPDATVRYDPGAEERTGAG
jgi:SAM-dependent methyltransferase